MNKVKIRAFIGYGVAGTKHNIRVLFPSTGFGYGKRLYCCKNCGELYCLDLENPALGDLKIPDDLGSGNRCCRCQSKLSDALLEYPQNFITEDGTIGHFNIPNPIPEETESIVTEVYELRV